VLLVAVSLLAVSWAPAAEKHNFNVAGTFVEGCTCQIVCHCNVSGAAHGCHAIEAIAITSGSYNGANLAGTKIAVAVVAREWAQIYVDAPGPAQREAATGFARALYGGDTKIEAVNNARVELSGRDGRYTLSVDGGKTIELQTEPVLGADARNPVMHSNTRTPLSPIVYQGRTIKGVFHDGNRSFILEAGNAFFNPHTHHSGKI
jgi:hypothetical protein